MNNYSMLFKLGRALLLFALLGASAGNALATPARGTQLDSYCALQPLQATAPQQSRPYLASGSSCLTCHTSATNPTINNLNALGTANIGCSGAGTATTCPTSVNPSCVAHAPSNATITAPPNGTSVAQGQSLTFTAGNATNPDGFPLAYTWLFSNGMPNVVAQSTAVPMTVAGPVTTTLQVRNSVGMLAGGVVPTVAVTVTGATNQAPVASITAPAANVTVTQGGTVAFAGSGTDPDNNLPLTYAWTFGGGTPASSTAQNPGAVQFNTAGTFTVSFLVRDSLGLASTAVTRTVTVTPPANQAPVATITAPAANVTVAQGGTVTFTGSGTDPDNNLPLTYAWTFGGGTPASSTAQNPGAVQFNTAGTFTVSFLVRDSLGLASTAVTRTVTVTPPGNLAPVATITAPAANVTVARGGTVTFAGSGSDPDNNLPLTYAWTFGGGTPASSTAQNPGAVQFNTTGTFTVSFLVRDSLGLASTTVTRTVTVTPLANQAPLATITAPAANVTVTQGGTVAFAGSGSDPDNNLPLTYAWTFGGGTPANSTAQNPGAVQFNTAGTFTVSFLVRDSLGLASATVTRTVTVTPANQAPVATITAPAANVTVAQGGTVTFAGSGSDPDNNLPLTYAWTFGGGTPASSTAQNPGAVRFNTAGTFTVSFMVRDSLGLASTTVTRTVTVTPAVNQPPMASITAPAINVSVLPGGSVTFSASATDPGNNLPLSYRWTFNGGTPSSSTRQNPGAVSFSNVGTFTVTLTVTDSTRLVSTPVTRIVTVAAPNQAPRVADSECATNSSDD